ncbi:MAG TPA: peptidoglycan editing factor PgeF [Solimonas sp.]|nr:peptidoglycan editing factor PgeF [Solimonas sp.]
MSQVRDLELLRPDWPAPPWVHAGQTTRRGGVSQGPWATLNLGAHCGDAPEAVAENRRRLAAALALPAEPAWLQQVHGTNVVELGAAPVGAPQADAAVARGPGQVCAVLTADCLPVLLCDRDGQVVGAAHAGWRGLLAGVLESAVGAMRVPPERLLAWLGAGIGPAAFEVGDEVRAAFVQRDPAAAAAFVPGAPGKHLADLYRLARLRLHAAGVGEVHGGGRCTLGERETFFSFRRDGRCGRMAALIWRA